MDGPTTSIRNPEDKEGKETKKFAFDFSYWSHDGFKKDDAGISVPDGPSSRYASQRMVYEDLGTDVLNNAWKGMSLLLELLLSCDLCV